MKKRMVHHVMMNVMEVSSGWYSVLKYFWMVPAKRKWLVLWRSNRRSPM